MSAPSNEKPTVGDTLKSLTGYDELAIDRAFGKGLDELNARELARALVFTLERRGGASDADAKRTALELPMSELDTRFETETEELDEEEPETPEGKGDFAAA